MKTPIKLAITAIIFLLGFNITFAGSSYVNQIDYSYNWSLDDAQVWTKMKIRWYIDPTTLQFWDGWISWINMKYSEFILDSKEFNNITGGASFWLFYPENDIQTTEYKTSDWKLTYSREFSRDYNKWLMLFASKSLIDSMNYYDPVYFDFWSGKNYNNWVNILRNTFENWEFINRSWSHIKWWTDIKWNIVASTWWLYESKEWNVVIEWEIREINIDEEIFMCGDYYNKSRCLNLVNEIKKDFYTWKIDSETFKNSFKRTWESNTTENIKINTKVFVMDKITVNGITYWQKAPIYKLSPKYKAKANKALAKVNKFPDAKKEKIRDKIRMLLEEQRYWRKNYEILKYLQNWMDNYYSEEKKEEARVILRDLQEDSEWEGELMRILTNLIWE